MKDFLTRRNIILACILAASIAAIILCTFKPEQKLQSEEPDQTISEDEKAGDFSEQLDSEEQAALEAPALSFADEWIENHTLEEKVAQLFILRPEKLNGEATVTEFNDSISKYYDEYPVGGVIFFADNLLETDQTRNMIDAFQNCATERTGLPLFICVDEEGGRVSRIANNPAFNVNNVGNMCVVGESGDTEKAYESSKYIGGYLKDLGFNVDLAPVADVLSNPEAIVWDRSFGSDPELVSQMVVKYNQGLKVNGILSAAKHFPGHGNTNSDTHEGFAQVNSTYDELKACDLIPFQKLIDDDIPFVMIGHVAYPNVTGTNEPATLSKKIVTDILRKDMGYDGLIITDSLGMGAITNNYQPEDSAVKAIVAGEDVLLTPPAFERAYNGVLKAVENGTISEDQIDASVKRIIEAKVGIGHK